MGGLGGGDLGGEAIGFRGTVGVIGRWGGGFLARTGGGYPFIVGGCARGGLFGLDVDVSEPATLNVTDEKFASPISPESLGKADRPI